MDDLTNLIGKNVRRLREAKSISANKLAKLVNVRLNTIQAIESGDTHKSKYLPDIARVLEVSIGELDPALASNPATPMTIVPLKELVGSDDLPVYGTTEAGEGQMVFTSDPVDRIGRPVELQHVKEAYGVIVRGGSMTPAVRSGAIVVVNPNLHPRREDTCVFRRQEHGEFYSTVKEFVSETADSWKVKRYQPVVKEFVLKKLDWPECHVVVSIHRQ